MGVCMIENIKNYLSYPFEAARRTFSNISNRDKIIAICAIAIFSFLAGYYFFYKRRSINSHLPDKKKDKVKEVTEKVLDIPKEAENSNREEKINENTSKDEEKKLDVENSIEVVKDTPLSSPKTPYEKVVSKKKKSSTLNDKLINEPIKEQPKVVVPEISELTNNKSEIPVPITASIPQAVDVEINSQTQLQNIELKSNKSVKEQPKVELSEENKSEVPAPAKTPTPLVNAEINSQAPSQNIESKFPEKKDEVQLSESAKKEESKEETPPPVYVRKGLPPLSNWTPRRSKTKLQLPDVGWD